MNTNLLSPTGRVASRLSLMMLMIFACVAPMQAERTVPQTFAHYEGRFPGASLVRTSLANYDHQKVHEDWNVVYANTGDQLKLVYRSTAFNAYVRWYDFETDSKVAGLTTNDDNNINQDEIGIISLNVTGNLASKLEPKRRALWTFEGTHRYIACEQSSYCDWGGTKLSDTAHFTHEPTLSQRLVYDIRPASEMAAQVDGATSDYLESYKMMAPTNTDVYIGPKFAYNQYSDSGYSYPNYYYNAPAPIHMLDEGTVWIVDGVKYTTAPTAAKREAGASVTVTKIVRTGGWQWKTATTDGGAKTNVSPVVTSGQFARFSNADAGIVYYYLEYNSGETVTTETWTVDNNATASKRKWATQTVESTLAPAAATYLIAKFEVDYRSHQEVGPYAMTDTAFMASAKTLAKQDFNFADDTDPSHWKKLQTHKLYLVPLAVEESNFGFYDGIGSTFHKPGASCYYNEYQFVNDGYGYDTKVPQFANHWCNGIDKTKGYALYADGSRKPGTVFSINFNADLCPGAKMYFSAWVGEHPLKEYVVVSHSLQDTIMNDMGATATVIRALTKSTTVSAGDTVLILQANGVEQVYLAPESGNIASIQAVNKTVASGQIIATITRVPTVVVADKIRPGSHAILDFIVLGVDADGNETTLTTFTTGEFTDACGEEWKRILFPLEYDANVDFDHYCLRVVNKAKDTYDNDFYIDDVFIKVLSAPFEPIQGTSPDECLTADSKLTMYTKLDFGQALQNVPEGTTDEFTSFYYRWIAKDVLRDGAAEESDYVRTSYLGVAGTSSYGEIQVPLNFKTLPAGYPEGTTFADFDEAYSQTDAPAVVFIKESGLPQVGDDKNTERYVAYVATPITKNGDTYSDYYNCAISQILGSLGNGNSCSEMNGTKVAFGVGINSSLGGEVDGAEKTACADYSYDLTYQVKYAVLKGNGTEVVSSVYVAHWLWGDSATVDANPDLFGATYTEIREAMEAYGVDGTNPALTAAQKAIIKRLQQRDLLTISKVAFEEDGVTAKEEGSDVTFVVLPIDGATSLSYTAFPIAALRSDAPHCTLPQTITLNFPTDDETPAPDRNVIRFVKTHGETVPAYVSSRPRRVRIPYKRNGERVSEQNVPIDLSDPTHQYKVVNLTLYATDDASFTSLLKQKTAVTATADKEPVTGEDCSIDFANLDALNEGKSYTFMMEYQLTDENGEDILNAACREEGTDSIHNGEAFIQFVVVPELLYLDAEAELTASWNDDYSWQYKPEGAVVSNIAPLKETSVILASGNHILLNPAASAVQEPALADRSNLVDPKAFPYITYDINYEPYTANNIFVPAHTAIVGQTNIDEKGTWTIEMPITPSKWILTAMPIRGVVSGDMFIPQAAESETDLFKVAAINQTVGQAAVDRTGNPMYNSLYNQKACQKDVSGTVDITSSTWTIATNSLNTKFEAGYGWALGYNGTATDKTIRLPKIDEVYHFFNAGGYWHAMTQNVDRTDAGKAAFQADAEGSMTVTLHNNTVSDIFLLGNPTFGYIDLAALQAANPSITAFYKAGLDEGRYALVSGTTEESEWRASLPEFEGMLAPMQSVFVKATAGSELDVTISKTMLRTSEKQYENNGTVAGAPRRVAAAIRDQVIYIEASALDFTSTAAVFESANASDEAGEEDVTLYMLDKTKTPFSIFTIAGNTALAVNQINEATVVPLAMYSETQVESEELTFSGDDDYLGEWDLVDQRSDFREPLYDGMTLTLSMATDGGVRYYLEHSRRDVPGTATDVEENAGLSIKAYTRFGQLTVFSDNDMADFRLYDAAGRLIMAEQNAGRVITASLTAGIYMVRANGEVLKVIVK